MISACKASMFHVAGYHDNCPKNQNSWCQYQQDMLNGTNSYKDKGGHPLDVRAAILPVYNDLCKRENVSKCLHRRTQNRNESFTGMIWNDGAIASSEIFKDMNMEPGDHMMKGLQIQNESRKIHAAYRISEQRLKRRENIRHCRKKKQDKNLDKKGPTY